MSTLAGVDAVTLEVEKTVLLAERYSGRPLVETVPLLLPAGDARDAHWPETLDGITLADVQRFAAEHYRPERATLLVTGDFDAEDVRSEVLAALPDGVTRATGQRVQPTRHALPPEPPPQAVVPQVALAVEEPELAVAWTMPDTYGEEWLQKALTAHLRPAGRASFITTGDLTFAMVRVPRDASPVAEQLSAVARKVEDALTAEPEEEVRWWVPRESRPVRWTQSAVARALQAHAGRLEPTAESSAQLFLRSHEWLSARRARGLVIVPGPQEVPEARRPPAETVDRPAPPPTREEIAALAAVPDLANARWRTLPNGLLVLALPLPWAGRVATALVVHAGYDIGAPGLAEALAAGLESSAETAPSARCAPRLFVWLARDVADVLQEGQPDQLRCMLEALSDVARQTPPYSRAEMATAKFHERSDALYSDLLYRRPLGARTVDFEQLRPEVVAAFHRAALEPSRSVLVVAGQLDPERVLALAEAELADWRSTGANAVTGLPPVTLAPSSHGKKVVLSELERTLPSVVVRCRQAPGAQRTTDVVRRLFGLYGEAMRTRYGQSYDATVEDESSPAGDWVGYRAEVLPDGVPQYVRELDAKLRGEPTDDDIARAKGGAASALRRHYRQSATDIAGTTAEELALGTPPEQLKAAHEAIADVSPAEARAAWKACRDTAQWNLLGDREVMRATATAVFGRAALWPQKIAGDGR